MMLLEGLNRIRTLHAADIINGILGTAATAVVESQTGLQNPITITTGSATTTTANKTTTLSYTLPSTTGTGYTYREFGTTNAGAVTDYDRVVFTGVEHTSADDIVIQKIYYYENG